ncbi:hypothetical protein [Halobacterium jilantaiense]|uniref:Uncharacterized protein n=1 Tax=Halobacterium jilantaiense TaxID=355548 RepID=A0A1I0NH23_9EURY|nr:hypothetical protein [Halobacterium jilantaiense]SEW00724.1 hypothetical protein SAMN04487945_0872 [Halobacterium jilantaiense]
MTGRSGGFGDHSLKTLEESRKTYLQSLRVSTADATFFSHQNALRKFFSWYSPTANKPDSPGNTLAEFAKHLLTTLGQSVDTVAGHIHSLLNFLAFHHQSSPDELRVRLFSEIQLLSCPESAKESLSKEFGFQAGSEITRSVDALRAYLRQRQYGTRTHAYVELILAARARPTQIRLLNRSDLHLDEQTASIPLSETYLIAATGLHNEQTVDLPPDLTNVLETYIEHERKTPSQSGCQPLFTTIHGRASVGTLRRSVKLASEKARDYHCATRETNPDDRSPVDSVTAVVPSDIYRVALSDVENTS